MAYDGKIQDYAPPVVDEIGAIILKARELIQEAVCLWQKPVPNTSSGTCIIIALGNAARTGLLLDRRVHAAELRVAKLLGYDGEKLLDAQKRIIAFNDDLFTTRDKVIELLDRAARPTREGE